ncbi:VC2046/SO_2500 family protein [Vibrio sp. TH_r3]|uniref:VC2046/SO_2500 family protein n=1 Tax=Vibrio sp. TH_r3 TaxID=3082084 RepID=UPI0029545202|nr:VC2046/SO_2500 family protein [Vibrio sp. TH_r3]MDV7103130.1 VC2046/SO_2500 family protein [Vibrio sp. TH_r3]
MQLNAIDNSETFSFGSINQLQMGETICKAVSEKRRADFALLVAMFSDDVRDNTPLDQLSTQTISEQELHNQFQIPVKQLLRSNQDSYAKSAHIANNFHQGGITSAKLQHELNPDALAYMTEHTCDLGEEVYNNLSIHAQHSLVASKKAAIATNDLYQHLVVNRRESQIHTSA